MSIRRVTCPGCGTVANAPAAMSNVRCPACGMVWNANQPSASIPKAPISEPSVTDDSNTNSTAMILAASISGVIALLVVIGIAVVVLSRQPSPPQVSATEVEITVKPATPEPYREINLPEETRRRIYNDYRKVARTTVERPLILPQGSKPRQSLEDMLQKTYDRELMHFAALHDISVDDVKEVIKEGDAKVWDDSPRSNAVRDGMRVYPKEMSEGWKPNPNRK